MWQSVLISVSLDRSSTDHFFKAFSFSLKVIMVSDFRLDREIALTDCFEDIPESIEWSGDTMREKHRMD